MCVCVCVCVCVCARTCVRACTRLVVRPQSLFPTGTQGAFGLCPPSPLRHCHQSLQISACPIDPQWEYGSIPLTHSPTTCPPCVFYLSPLALLLHMQLLLDAHAAGEVTLAYSPDFFPLAVLHASFCRILSTTILCCDVHASR